MRGGHNICRFKPMWREELSYTELSQLPLFERAVCPNLQLVAPRTLAHSRKDMKLTHKSVLIKTARSAIMASALLCSTVGVMNATPDREDTCNDASLSGAYGLLQSGSTLAVGPVSSVGIAKFDGNGHWTLAESLSVNGNLRDSFGSGEYTIAENCTGTLVLGFADGTAQRNMSMIILNDGRELHMIVSNPGNVTTAVLKSIRSRHCSNATLKGDYSYVQNGTVVGEGPFASLGFTRFDGEGGLSTIEFTSRNGTITPETIVFGSGTYQVNADCTGYAIASTRRRDLVIVDRGSEYYTLVTVPGRVIPGVQKRQE